MKTVLFILFLVCLVGCAPTEPSHEEKMLAVAELQAQTRPAVELLRDDSNATFYRVQAEIGGSGYTETVVIKVKPSGEWFVVHDKDDLAVTKITVKED